MPSNKKLDEFNQFKSDIKSLLLESGAKELKTAKKSVITHVSIKKIFGYKNVEWSLGEDTNILIGKNGSGKSTILKLIYACLNNNIEILEYFGSPYIELTILRKYDNNETQEFKITNSKSLANINVVMVNTFDMKSDESNKDSIDLDSKLIGLVAKFGEYQRSLTQIINKRTDKQKAKKDEILRSISTAEVDTLSNLQKLLIEINEITDEINQPVLQFKKLVDEYFSGTNKTLIIDNEEAPLLAEVLHKDETRLIKITDLSSGEKQLLIIFLTIVLQKKTSFILLMDEPETSLHVEWQSTFIDNIKKINSNIQIIIATHNPLILLNRNQNEIGIIETNNEVVQNKSDGTTYLDISSILLNYFQLPSLIGTQMQNDIKKFTELKINEDNLNFTEKNELDRIGELLERSLVGDVFYNNQYFNFLKFLKENKGINFEQYEDINKDDMSRFMNDFRDFFND